MDAKILAVYSGRDLETVDLGVMVTKTLTAVDLFAGAGGLSLGFEMAGFDVPLAVEIDAWAAETYKYNRPKCCVVQSDITELSDAFFSDYRGVDVVMGGPPCQGFSISASNRRNTEDPRNFLYRQFLRVVSVIKPRMVLVENVKGFPIARLPDGRLLLEDFCESLANMGYSVDYKLLDTANFGVPQHRVRFFLTGSLDGVPDVLGPMALQVQPIPFLDECTYRTLWDSISDLPTVNPRELREDDVLAYDKPPSNDYQRQLRFGSNSVYNHIPMRHSARVIERFRCIPIGGNLTTAAGQHGARQRGNPSNFSGVVYDQNHRRPDPNKPSPTITASFYSSFIHPYEERNFTVREAARIQSFPDFYRFYGKRTTLSKKLLLRKGIHEDIHLDQFNQVGNSVPPILAEELAKKFADRLVGNSCSITH